MCFSIIGQALCNCSRQCSNNEFLLQCKICSHYKTVVGGLARGVQQPLQALEPNYPFTDLILEHMHCPYVVPATVPIEPMHTADTGCLDMRSDVQFAHDLCFLPDGTRTAQVAYHILQCVLVTGHADSLKVTGVIKILGLIFSFMLVPVIGFRA